MKHVNLPLRGVSREVPCRPPLRSVSREAPCLPPLRSVSREAPCLPPLRRVSREAPSLLCSIVPSEAHVDARFVVNSWRVLAAGLSGSDAAEADVGGPSSKAEALIQRDCARVRLVDVQHHLVEPEAA